MSAIKDLKALCDSGRIRPIDYQFAKMIAEQCDPALSENQVGVVAYIAAATSFELNLGNVCVSLLKISAFVTMVQPQTNTHFDCSSIPPISEWEGVLFKSGVCNNGVTTTPLVMERGNVYIYRYWLLELNVANKLKQLSMPIQISELKKNLAKDSLNKLFSRNYVFMFEQLKKVESTELLFDFTVGYLDVDALNVNKLDRSKIEDLLINSNTPNDLRGFDLLVPQQFCLDWQKVAASIAISRKLAVITGGAGTGKTSTVVKMLAAMCEVSDIDLVIKLCAPTGKAATRLTESVSKAMRSLPVSQKVRELIPSEASTVHRLLGAIYKQAAFRHGEKNKLHLDVLVVDEASMVDLVLMGKLLDAIPDNATLILLGDKDQLSSVEAGAVLGDICELGDKGFSHQQQKLLTELSGYNLENKNHSNSGRVSDSLCSLVKSYRFHEDSGVGVLANAVKFGDISSIDNILTESREDVFFVNLTSDSYKKLISDVAGSYIDYINLMNSPARNEIDVLSAFASIRLLCAVREGNCGVSLLNQRVEAKLEALGVIQKNSTNQWYLGRPVMVIKNDHALGLYNGDIGVCMKDQKDGNLYVYFVDGDGKLKRFLPSRLPLHETVFAMTIHKSQGSEFNKTYLLLPEQGSGVVSRELIYTGITRARGVLTIYGTRKVLIDGVSIKTKRESGLGDLLAC